MQIFGPPNSKTGSEERESPKFSTFSQESSGWSGSRTKLRRRANIGKQFRSINILNSCRFIHIFKPQTEPITTKKRYQIPAPIRSDPRMF